MKVTTVEFVLKPYGKRTRLKLLESGIECPSEDKRLQAFRDNEGRWDIQTENIQNNAK